MSFIMFLDDVEEWTAVNDYALLGPNFGPIQGPVESEMYKLVVYTHPYGSSVYNESA